MKRMVGRCASGIALAALAMACRPATGADESGSTSGDGDGDGDGDEDTGPDPGEPPTTPTPTTPPNGAMDVPIEVALCWSPSQDPEGAEIEYEVELDGQPLGGGILGEDGFDDVCTPELDLNYQQTYVWRVRAVERAIPNSVSEWSTPSSFTTMLNPDSEVVFEDDFSEDKGWTFGGDALEGHWLIGDPGEAIWTKGMTMLVSQPEDCAGGEACLFTGENPDGIAHEGDVDEGTTWALSPPFDLSEAGSASVGLSRWFFEDELEDSGNSLRVELLVPDEDAPDGFFPFVLEQVDALVDEDEHALWTPVAFDTCGVPLGPDMRLRLSASELGNDVVEALVDNVVVTAYAADTCEPGPGQLCDPADADACGDELGCCPQGDVNAGVYRCDELVPHIDPDNPPDEPGGELTGELACPASDLVLWDQDLGIFFDQVEFEPDDCAVFEGCVGGTGVRRLMRFNGHIRNQGSRDLVLGPAANHPDLYEFSECHMHYHFQNFARYSLVDDDEVVVGGHKQAFCIIDWNSWAWPWLEGAQVGGNDGQYTCFNQGLGLGWQDTYANDVDCQWIDVTDVDPGDYVLRVELNFTGEGEAAPRLVESNYDNNVTEIEVTIPPP